MYIFLVITITIVILFSFISSFIAVITILSNDFDGSKTQWVLISMIGLIGPILWLTKGRKLIK